MSISTAEAREFARARGADLVGVAPAEALEAAPPGHRPADILPGARSVVACARRIPHGVLYGPPTSYQATMNAIHARLDLLVTPEFGNRVHLVSVVTDVALEPDPTKEWDPCPHGCRACLQACPAGAIGEGQQVDQALCRPVVMQRLAKGAVVEGCWACRKACPLGDQ